MNEKQLREKLYEKLNKDWNSFIKSVKSKKPEDIIKDAYQIAIKEELLSMFYPEFEQYDIEEIKVLCKAEYPLEELYQGWLDSDCGINSVLEDSISNTIEELAKEQRERKNDMEK